MILNEVSFQIRIESTTIPRAQCGEIPANSLLSKAEIVLERKAYGVYILQVSAETAAIIIIISLPDFVEFVGFIGNNDVTSVPIATC